jgi:hypothetical protein
VVPVGEGTPCHARRDDYPGKAHVVYKPAQISVQAVCSSAVVESLLRRRCLSDAKTPETQFWGPTAQTTEAVRCAAARGQGTTGIRGAPSADTIRQPTRRVPADARYARSDNQTGGRSRWIGNRPCLVCVLSHKPYLTRLACSVWATLAIPRWPQREAALASTGNELADLG